MEESRCAITKLVRPWASRAIAFWISTSVRVSTELVASSSTRITGSDRNARAIVISCFSPALTPAPSSSITVSYPSGSVRTKRSAWAARAASSISSRVTSREAP